MEEAVADGVLNADVVLWSDPQEAPAREFSRLGFFLQLAGQNAPAESRASPPPPPWAAWAGAAGGQGSHCLASAGPSCQLPVPPPEGSLLPHPPSPNLWALWVLQGKGGGLPFLSPQHSPEALEAQAQRELPCRVLLTAHGGRHQLRVLQQYGQLTVALAQQAAVVDVGRTFGRKGREGNPRRAWVSLPSTPASPPTHQ